MLFDPQDESLTRFDARNSEGKGIENCISLLYDPLGDLWIGTDDGLFRWDERIGRLFRYELEEGDGSACRGIRTIFEDSGGESGSERPPGCTATTARRTASAGTRSPSRKAPCWATTRSRPSSRPRRANC